MHASRRLTLAQPSPQAPSMVVADIAGFLSTLALLAVNDPREAEAIGGPLINAMKTAEARALAALRAHLNKGA